MDDDYDDISVGGGVDEPVDDDEVAEEPVEDEEAVEDEPIDDIISSTMQSKYSQEKIVIDPSNWITSDRLSLAEITSLIGSRATQIANHNNPLVDVSECTNFIDCAKKELAAGVFPLDVEREVGRQIIEGVEKIFVELRDPNVMILPANWL